MKGLLFSVLFLFSFQAFANGVFRSDTPVPQELQAKIIREIRLSCPAISSLYEVRTMVRIELKEGGKMNTFFTSKFAVSWYFVASEFVSSIITVESGKLDVYGVGADRLPVMNINSEACD